MLKYFLKLDRNILLAITAEFFLQLVNSAFLAIQPLYMQNEGYSDAETAEHISYRFLAILISAFPLGLYIRKHKIKPFFYFSSLGVPLFALVIIYAIQIHNDALLYVSQFLWGVSLTALQTPVLPYILRNSPVEDHTAAISLSYSTWHIASIIGGGMIALLNTINPVIFDERMVLIIISVVSISGVVCVLKIDINEAVPEISNKNNFETDWPKIIKALTPTTILAIGAGFTIPFLSLFFANVHHLTTSQYSLWYLAAAILVVLSSMAVPYIKKRFGYIKAVPVTQSIALIALVVMATTQYYSQMNIAVSIAVTAFLFRQPLMNIAGPMTTDVVMDYVGSRNREIVSGLTAAIWSGSWFVSALLFSRMRDSNYSYVSIFMITAAFYVVGIIWYYLLIREYNRKTKMSG